MYKKINKKIIALSILIILLVLFLVVIFLNDKEQFYIIFGVGFISLLISWSFLQLLK